MRLPQRVLATIIAFRTITTIALFLGADNHGGSATAAFSVCDILLAAFTTIVLAFGAVCAFGLLLAFAAYGVFAFLDGGNCAVGYWFWWHVCLFVLRMRVEIWCYAGGG